MKDPISNVAFRLQMLCLKLSRCIFEGKLYHLQIKYSIIIGGSCAYYYKISNEDIMIVKHANSLLVHINQTTLLKKATDQSFSL